MKKITPIILLIISFFIIFIPFFEGMNNSGDREEKKAIKFEEYNNKDAVEASIELFEKGYFLEYSFNEEKFHFFTNENLFTNFINNYEHFNELYNNWKVLNIYQIDNQIILEIDKNI